MYSETFNSLFFHNFTNELFKLDDKIIQSKYDLIKKDMYQPKTYSCNLKENKKFILLSYNFYVLHFTFASH